MQGDAMPQRPYVIDQLISAKAIAARVEGLAAEIATAFAGTDKLVVVAREAQNRTKLFDNEDWRNTYAVAAQAVLSKPLIRVDVPAMSISY